LWLNSFFVLKKIYGEVLPSHFLLIFCHIRVTIYKYAWKLGVFSLNLNAIKVVNYFLGKERFMNAC